MAEIFISNLTKTYADGTVAVQDLTLSVADGEFLVLVGPSGCGKSTILRCVAGLETSTSGAIAINGRRVDHLPPQSRDLAMVFQTYALYPHLNVYDNLAFGLKVRGVPKDEVRERVQAVAAQLAILPHLQKKPRELSGGERQRVALGRAIVRQPRAFLMDEPLSNLDAALRVKMRTELLKLHRELGITVLYVTHDQTEALTMGDRVAVLHNGRLQQVAPPRELYERPANQFVAAFIGSPAMNFITARLSRRTGELFLEVAGLTQTLPRHFLEEHPELSPFLEQPVIIGVRPEHLGPARPLPGQTELRLAGTVDLVETLGPVNQVHLALTDPLSSGDQQVSVTATLDTAVQATVGADLDISCDLSRLHFFQAADGQRL
jgi:multiple sugar transport system ATP-binding protein